MARAKKPFTYKPKFDDGEVRHYYNDAEIAANFDVPEFLEAHTRAIEVRNRRGNGVGSLADRKRELRRRIGMEGMSLEEAREYDFDAYADDSKSRLKELLADYHRLPENQPKVGEDFYQATVIVLAPSGHGKGIFADDLLGETQALAAQGGRSWRRADPAGRNAIEGVRRCQLVMHDDARFWMLPTSDEMYRYLDANRMSESDTRYAPTAAYAPRVVVLTTSNTLYEFALTVVTRKPSDYLADQAEFRSSMRPRNIDELLRRLAWCVEVHSPDWVTVQEGQIPKTEYAALMRQEMVVSFFRVRKAQSSRDLNAKDREGALLGAVSTNRELELIARVKGSRRASRFLASTIIEEYSPDVAQDIPDAVIQAYLADRRIDEQQSRHEVEQQMLIVAHTANGSLGAQHFTTHHLSGLQTPDPTGRLYVSEDDTVACDICIPGSTSVARNAKYEAALRDIQQTSVFRG